jgi:hypothetical protein
MVLVLFSVTFFLRRIRNGIRKACHSSGDISNFNCRIASGGSHCDPHRTQCEGASFIPSPTMATVPYSLKEPLFYLIYFLEVSHQILFDTDGIGDIMSCFFTIPVSIISSILSACNCFIAEILSALSYQSNR